MSEFIEFLCSIAAGIFLGWFVADIYRLYKLGFREGFGRWKRRDWYLWAAWMAVLIYVLVNSFKPVFIT